MTNSEITAIEKQIFELTAKLNKLRQANSGNEVGNYGFDTLEGR